MNLEEKEYSFSVPGVVEIIPPGLKIALDVGCSGGGLGYYLKSQLNFQEVVGIEYSQKAAQKANQFLDKVYTGDACAVKLPNKFKNHFDIIIYADVLEHLYNPWKVIYRHKQYLKKGGYILASIPNLKNLYIILNLLMGRFDYTQLGLLDRTHIRFFTGDTAVEMFVKQGLMAS